MRVISGTAGGIPLLTPKTDLRPTMDLVRGAIFSSLGEVVVGARVLDLFSGTGSLAIEALSRGAAEATLVELNRKACAVIEQNLQRTSLLARARLVAVDVFQYLRKQARVAQVDLIFADPPYAKTRGERDWSDDLVRLPELLRVLAPGGLFLLETARGWKMPEATEWECVRLKEYGATQTLLLRPAEGRGGFVDVGGEQA